MGIRSRLDIYQHAIDDIIEYLQQYVGKPTQPDIRGFHGIGWDITVNCINAEYFYVVDILDESAGMEFKLKWE